MLPMSRQNRLIVLLVDILMLDRAPGPLDEDVSEDLAAIVVDHDPSIKQPFGKLSASELRSFVAK